MPPPALEGEWFYRRGLKLSLIRTVAIETYFHLQKEPNFHSYLPSFFSHRLLLHPLSTCPFKMRSFLSIFVASAFLLISVNADLEKASNNHSLKQRRAVLAARDLENTALPESVKRDIMAMDPDDYQLFPRAAGGEFEVLLTVSKASFSEVRGSLEGPREAFLLRFVSVLVLTFFSTFKSTDNVKFNPGGAARDNVNNVSLSNRFKRHTNDASRGRTHLLLPLSYLFTSFESALHSGLMVM